MKAIFGCEVMTVIENFPFLWMYSVCEPDQTSAQVKYVHSPGPDPLSSELNAALAAAWSGCDISTQRTPLHCFWMLCSLPFPKEVS